MISNEFEPLQITSVPPLHGPTYSDHTNQFSICLFSSNNTKGCAGRLSRDDIWRVSMVSVNRQRD